MLSIAGHAFFIITSNRYYSNKINKYEHLHQIKN
ncbi:hypothetical protein SAMN05421740_102584 [Parapedobacter koreensis]|uniref:Uncharacterized protein n=1 Tax=Parapedobacter koreensis TaxID=332977 RepID=A0A1H7JJF7_9SPHI|nr:hypothetical protein SAMN05421740_102584 [Parapedobacter koreensis]